MDSMEWAIGLIGSSLIAAASYWKKSLSPSGVLGAILLGTLLFALGTASWYGTMILFFVTSSLLSKWKRQVRAKAESKYQKTGRRDIGQVLANGGAGLLCCLGNVWWPSPLWFAGYLGAMATATADTWATEIGGLSTRPPRSIRTWKPVEPGTSGGVTPLGLVAALAGGGMIGASAWALSGEVVRHLSDFQLPELWPLVKWMFLGAGCGLVGATFDSWLGAGFQAVYRCPRCGDEVEGRVHCQTPAVPIRGYRWMDNDAVNFASTCIGAMVGAGLVYGFG